MFVNDSLPKAARPTKVLAWRGCSRAVQCGGVESMGVQWRPVSVCYHRDRLGEGEDAGAAQQYAGFAQAFIETLDTVIGVVTDAIGGTYAGIRRCHHGFQPLAIVF